MLRYVIKRIGIGLVTLLALVVVTFLLVHLMPGNPFESHPLQSGGDDAPLRP